MTLFAVWPEPAGGILWKVFNCLFYAAGLWRWARRVLPARFDSHRVGIFFLLALPNSLISMYNGQANLLMTGAILFGLASAVDRRWNLAAAWIALATLVKAYPLAIGLLLAALYPVQFAGRFATALALGFLLPMAMPPYPASFQQSPTWLAMLYDTSGVRPEKYRSIDQLWRVYYEPLSPHAYLVLGLLAGLAVLALGLFFARQRMEPRKLMTWIFIGFACWTVLFGPTTEAATYAIVAPAIAWCLMDAFSRPTSWATRSLLLASLLMMGPLATDFFGSAVRLFVTSRGGLPLGALLFLGYLLAEAARWRPEKETAVGGPARIRP
jgi:hypothetical protein